MKWALQITLTVLMLLVGSLSWSEDLSETGQKQIYKALDRNLSHLSENGKKEMQRGQKEWRVFVDSFCSKNNLRHNYNNTNECRADQYRKRLENLKLAVRNHNGLIVRRDEHIETIIIDVTDKVSGNQIKWASQIMTAWPQIDNPVQPAHYAWNKAMKQSVSNDAVIEGRVCDLWHHYELSFGRADIVSVYWSREHYCPNAAHGWADERYDNRVLSENRALKAADVFNQKTDWVTFIKDRAVEDLNEQGKEGDLLLERPYLLSTIEDPVSWEINEKGITFNFGDVNGRAGGMYRAMITWDEMTPVLNDRRIKN